MRTRPSRQILQEALVHFDVVASYGAGDVSDQKTIDAICMRLSAGIEALSALDAAERESLFGSVWAQMWGMRTGSRTATS